MAPDLKTLAIMCVGGVAGVYFARRAGVLSDVLLSQDTQAPILSIPEMGLGRGKNNLANSSYIAPALVAVAAYYYM